MPARPLALVALLPSVLFCAEPPLESIRFKDTFTLLFPSGYEMSADSDRVTPAVIFTNSLDQRGRVEARVCRPDQQEKQFSMEKIFWASGIAKDEIVKQEKLANGDFLLTGKHAGRAKAAYFAKGARGHLQVNVEGPDSLAECVARIARSLKSVERPKARQEALPLKTAEYVYDRDTVRILVPEGARGDLQEPSTFWLPLGELDNIRVFGRSGFDYPYDELGKWVGAPADAREVVSNKVVNFDIHVLQFKPKGGKQEFYCYLGADHENKIVISGPREYADVMKLMAESAGVRRAGQVASPPRQAASPALP